MHLIKLFNIGILLMALAAAAPDNEVENQPSSPPPLSPSTSLPEPDPRFTHITLAHPYAEIHVPHPTEIAHLTGLRNNTSISKRDGQQVFGVYECSKKFFKGDCTWTQIYHNEKKCYNAKYWPNGSIGPDKGVKCVIFTAKECNYRRQWEYALEWPGVPDCADNPFMREQLMDLCPQSWTCDFGT